MELSDIRIACIRQAGVLIRMDWSGFGFDGRSVHDWICTALDGKDEEVAQLKHTLDAIQASYDSP